MPRPIATPENEGSVSPPGSVSLPREHVLLRKARESAAYAAKRSVAAPDELAGAQDPGGMTPGPGQDDPSARIGGALPARGHLAGLARTHLEHARDVGNRFSEAKGHWDDAVSLGEVVQIYLLGKNRDPELAHRLVARAIDKALAASDALNRALRLVSERHLAELELARKPAAP